MTGGQARSRTSSGIFAGAILVVDGLLALLTGAGLLLMSLFPPVAAIEGRPPIVQQWYLPAALASVVAIAGFGAAARAIRGVRAGRLVGVGVVLVGAAVSAGLALETVVGAELRAAFAGSAIAHAVAAIALLRWPDPAIGSSRTA